MRSIILKCLLVLIPLFSFSFKAIDGDDIYGKLSIETMFSPKDEAKVISKIKEFLPELQIIKIKYEEKIFIIKVSKQTRYESIKQSFDRAGLRILKDEFSKTKLE